MVHAAIYWSLLLLTLAYTWARGGAPERWAASMLAGASAASMLSLAPLASRYQHVEAGAAIADACLFAGYLALALRSTRYWPSWIAAIQFLQLLSHLVAALPHVLVMIYGIMISIWGYPMIVAIAVGTLRHSVRLSRGLDERPWTTSD